MKFSFVLIICLVILVTVSSKKAHHKKNEEKKHFAKAELAEKDVFDLLSDDEAEDERRRKKKLKLENEEEDVNIIGGYVDDPCAKHHCGPGRYCELNGNGKPHCICVKSCPPERDSRRKVCTNHNETWDSDCELYRMRCLCDTDNEQCHHHKYKHAHVDYYGACREIESCGKDELADFPRRMREWLFNVMQDLARRDELRDPYLKLEQQAEKQLSRKWVNAVIWKFCDLDVHPHDRAVSRHELFPLRAPLMAMEHCIAPFLDGCDANDDHKVSLLEWGKCLGLAENEIEDKCAYIVDSRQG